MTKPYARQTLRMGNLESCCVYGQSGHRSENTYSLSGGGGGVGGKAGGVVAGEHGHIHVHHHDQGEIFCMPLKWFCF